MKLKKFIRNLNRKNTIFFSRNLKSIHSLRDKLAKSILVFEAILSIFLMIGVIIGVFHLAKYFVILSTANIEQTFNIFYDFLDHLLLLIIGLELIIMLIRHDASSIIEVLLFAIARKILIHTTSMVDLSLGIIALAGVLAIRKYLLIDNLSGQYFGYILGAAVDVDDVNRLMNIHLPLEKAKTLGGFVVQLAEEKNKSLRPGLSLRHKKVEFEILEINEGVIEKIRVTKVD